MTRATACWRFGTCSAASPSPIVYGGSPAAASSRARRRSSSNSGLRQSSRSMRLRCAAPFVRVEAISERQACSRSCSKEKLTGTRSGAATFRYASAATTTWRRPASSVSTLDDLLIVPVEESEQQGADVGPVDVGVAHEDDGVVT